MEKRLNARITLGLEITRFGSFISEIVENIKLFLVLKI